MIIRNVLFNTRQLFIETISQEKNQTTTYGAKFIPLNLQDKSGIFSFLVGDTVFKIDAQMYDLAGKGLTQSGLQVFAENFICHLMPYLSSLEVEDTQIKTLSTLLSALRNFKIEMWGCDTCKLKDFVKYLGQCVIVEGLALTPDKKDVLEASLSFRAYNHIEHLHLYNDSITGNKCLDKHLRYDFPKVGDLDYLLNLMGEDIKSVKPKAAINLSSYQDATVQEIDCAFQPKADYVPFSVFLQN